MAAASKEEIKAWLTRDEAKSATHVIIVVDTWDYEDYPVYVSKEEDVEERLSDIRHGQNRAMEVYDLSINIDQQLNQPRAWNT